MNRIITIKDSLVKPMAALIRSQQENIRKQIEEHRVKIAALEKEYEENESTLNELGLHELELLHNNVDNDFGFDTITTASSRINGYDINASLWEKTLYVFKAEEKALSAKQILNTIFEYEPELKQATNDRIKKLEVNIFSTLTHKVKQNSIGRIKINKQYKYGLLKWFDKYGNLKKEFMI